MAGPGVPGKQLDLTATEQGAPPVPLTPITESLGEKASLADWTRVAIAGGLLLILAVLTLGAAWYVSNYPSKEKAIEAFLQLVFTPIVGLVGSVIGFYFGSRATGRSGSDSN